MSVRLLDDPQIHPGNRCDIIGIVENVVGPAQRAKGADWRLNIELINLRDPEGNDDPNLPAGDRGAYRCWIRPGKNGCGIDRSLLPIVQPGDVIGKARLKFVIWGT